MLAPRGLSFELHANWHQLADAAKLFAAHPETVVIVNHMGCPHMGPRTDDAVLATWRAAIRDLEALPNVYMKASNLEFVRDGWMRDAVRGASDRRTATRRVTTHVVHCRSPHASPAQDAYATAKSMVREVVDVFGEDRVMVASNFPVDRVTTGEGMSALYAAMHSLVDDLPLATRVKLFRDNAKRVYKLGA
mgnify:CR=1 FL=1